jgi:hypothetical protein
MEFRATHLSSACSPSINHDRHTLRPLRTRIFVTNSSILLPFSRGANENINQVHIHKKHLNRLTSVHDLPMVEHTLGESLAGGVRAQLSVESKRFCDRQEGLDGKHGCSWTLLLAEHLSTALVQTAVNSANGVFRALNFDCDASRSGTTRG